VLQLKELDGKNSRFFDERDLILGATVRDLRSVNKILALIKSDHMERMLDVGCGYGGLARYVGDTLAISEIHGIDINVEMLNVARSRGIVTHKIDVDTEIFPFPSLYFDLVTSFGVVEHLISYDNFLRETYRVLKKNGFFILSMPNLGSYINRVALLFGYQPREVEISQVHLPGVLPMYSKQCMFHLHSATLRAIKELLNLYNFQIISIKPLMPLILAQEVRTLWRKIAYFFDKTIGRTPSLSRRFIILAKK
jgi:ubiquinone/menaquinone biosynthesis C-methylase UbiE